MQEKIKKSISDHVSNQSEFTIHDEFSHLRKNGVFKTAVTIVCSMVGVGMLGLPSAFARLGWIPGCLVFLFTGCIATYCGLCLVKCMSFVEPGGRQLRSYPELGQFCFGGFGKFISYFATYGTCIGVGILFIVLAAQSCQELNNSLSYNVWACICTLIIWPSCLMKTLHGASLVAVLGFVASLAMAVILVAENFVFLHTRPEGVATGPTELIHHNIFDIGLAFSTIVFAYGGICVFPELHSVMKSPSKFPFSIFLALPTVCFIYYFVTFTSYIAYGVVLREDRFQGNVALNIGGDISRWAISISIIIHVLSAYIVYMNPFFREIEVSYKMDFCSYPFIRRTILRTSLLGFTLFIAVLIPFFGDVMSLLGATTQSLASFLLPIAFHTKLFGLERFRRHWIYKIELVFAGIVFIFTSIAGIIGFYVSLRNIVEKSSTYTFF